MSIPTERKRAWRAAGLCYRCGRPRADGDPAFCSHHRAYEDARRAGPVRSGTCCECGGQVPRGRRTTCSAECSRRHRCNRAPEPLPPGQAPICRLCAGLPWRRSIAGCPLCGGAWGAERAAPRDCAGRSSWTW